MTNFQASLTFFIAFWVIGFTVRPWLKLGDALDAYAKKTTAEAKRIENETNP